MTAPPKGSDMLPRVLRPRRGSSKIEQLRSGLEELRRENALMRAELDELRGNVCALANHARTTREVQKIIAAAIDPSVVPPEPPRLRLVPSGDKRDQSKG